MDIRADEAKNISDLITTWLTDEKNELEVTFGENHVVDSNTFLSVAQYLRTKGFEFEPQDDYLNIITPSIRFTLHGLGVIEQYCTDNSLDGKMYEAIIKESARNKLDIDEYNIRFKLQRENKLTDDDPRVADMIKHWKTQKKAFRMIRRWSFRGKGIRVDMSMIRQSPTEPNGGFVWYNKFTDAQLPKQLVRYEIEVELLHNTQHTTTEKAALSALIAGVGEVLRAIQKNVLLIRKSVANQVRAEYGKLVNTGAFRGVNPVTLLRQNMEDTVTEDIPNIRTGYNVTDKADGLRAMGFVNSVGELYLIDQSLNVYRTGLVDEEYANSLLDGEWVTRLHNEDPTNRYLIFDVYVYKSKKVSDLPFFTAVDVDPENPISRYIYLVLFKQHKFTIITRLKDTHQVPIVSVNNQLQVIVKEFEIAEAGLDIFKKCKTVLNKQTLYNTDGLIITTNSLPIPEESGKRFNEQFKWKPAKDNTIDFLVTFEKDGSTQQDKITSTVDTKTGLPIQYKTLRLYVGTRQNTNFRDIILQQHPLKQQMYLRPNLFYPAEYPNPFANTCYRYIQKDMNANEYYVMTEDTKEPIQHNSIVEMRYEIGNDDGWQWVPTRIRHDKTERLHRQQSKIGKVDYSKTMNYVDVANSVWDSIHNPITEFMISTGAEAPSELEMEARMASMVDSTSGMSKKYYEQNVSKSDKRKVQNLLDFHNKYIKNTCLIKRALNPGKTLLDIACGRGGDINKWIEAKAGYIFGIDIAENNILHPEDGAYERYVGRIRNMSHPEHATKMVFAVGDSSKNIVTGEAGASHLDKILMQSIFGKYPPDSTPPPYITRTIRQVFYKGADVVACMFAIHYFFKNMDTLHGLLQNLSETVKVGGHFIGCCFDGDTVFRNLASIETNYCMEGKKDGTQIWSIRKDYTASEFLPNESSVGLPISVNFISIGSTYTEYLVSFPFLVEKLKAIGLELVESKLFETSHYDAQDSKQFYNMSDSEKAYSYMNRWFIFKRIEVDVSGAIVQGEIPMPPIPSDADIARSKFYRTFEKTLIDADPEYEKFITVESSNYSVLKPWHKKQVQQALVEWFPDARDVKLIVDGTTHIGVDAVHFARVYPHAEIHACEIVPEIAVALQLNIRNLNVPNVLPHVVDISLWNPEDITSWSTQTQVDILFVDPPWGGKGYDKVPKLDLYLEEELEEGQLHNSAKNVKVLLAKWLDSGFIGNVIIKVPKNYNMDGLPNYVEKDIYDARPKKGGKLDYKMLWFKGNVLTPANRAKKINEHVSRRVTTAAATLANPSKAIIQPIMESEEDMNPPFVFGPFDRQPKDNTTNMALWNTLSTATSPADIKELPSTAGIWLDMSAQFILPDVVDDMEPLIKASVFSENNPKNFRKYIESYTSTLQQYMYDNPEDTRMRVYPTMDYYMTAMKIAFTEKAQKPTNVALFMTIGPYFKKFGIPLEEHVDYSNSYFKKIIKQYDKLYSNINTTEGINNIQYKEELWSAAKDVFVSFIITFRLQYDPLFGRIIYFLKEHGHMVSYDSNKRDSELERTETGIMIANIINNLTLDEMQFVYQNTLPLPQQEDVAEEVAEEEPAAAATVIPSLPVLEERAELSLTKPVTNKSTAVTEAPAADTTAPVPRKIASFKKKATTTAASAMAAPAAAAPEAPTMAAPAADTTAAPTAAAPTMAAPAADSTAHVPRKIVSSKKKKTNIDATAAPSAPEAAAAAAVTPPPNIKFKSTKKVQKP